MKSIISLLNFFVFSLSFKFNSLTKRFVNHKSFLNSIDKSSSGIIEEITALRRKRDSLREELTNAELLLREKKETYFHGNHQEVSGDEDDIRNDDNGFNYGFLTKSMDMGVNSTLLSSSIGQDTPGTPLSAVKLSWETFSRELKALLGRNDEIIDNDNNNLKYKLTQKQYEYQKKLKMLSLSNEAIWQRERNRPAVKSPLVIKIPYYFLCYLLDKSFEDSPIERFWFLETVARIPYFSYITLIHTYETLGWWRRSTVVKRVHFAEEINEYHHLLIMESLGGNQKWRVRFLAQHAAVAYFYILLLVWALSPSLAYNFSELIEAHAVDTYTEFAESNKETLKSLPPPFVAKTYYEGPDMYMFDEFQTGVVRGSRRPIINNLYDTFLAIAGDEKAHVSTMKSCQDGQVVLSSPNTEALVLAAIGAGAITAAALNIHLNSVDININDVVDAVSDMGDMGDAIGSVQGGIDAGALLDGAATIGAGITGVAQSTVEAAAQVDEGSGAGIEEAMESTNTIIKFIQKYFPRIRL